MSSIVLGVYFKSFEYLFLITILMRAKTEIIENALNTAKGVIIPCLWLLQDKLKERSVIFSFV
jgi:hypothetical protein